MKIYFHKRNAYWLSNFYLRSLTYCGRKYESSEHAYQAEKSATEAGRKWVSEATSPGYAKKRGRTVVTRPEWYDIKIEIMYEIVCCKFVQNTILKQDLLATMEAELIEYTTWNDRFWGVGTDFKGENHLGKCLMRARNDIRIGIVTEQSFN